ncbi:MAG: hypothetical protein K2J00_08570 [Bacteroidaceae bacterium]|nr:hypothetical protein [Bacteroidaceae bacterium]
MRRLLFLLMLVVCMLCEMHAQQMYNIYVKNPEGKPLKGVIVYTFPIRSKGEAAYSEGRSNKEAGSHFDKKKHNLLDEGKTDTEGLCVLRCSKDGAIILDGGDVASGLYDFRLYRVDKYKKGELDLNIELVLPGTEFSQDRKTRVIHADKAGEYASDGEAEMLQEVKRVATPQMELAGGGVERHGRNRILITKVLDIYGEHARDDARFVAFPYVVYDDFKDSVSYMPPAVVDGRTYSRSMERRMGFRPSRDKLDEYRFDRSLRMQSHNSERILYSQWANIKKGTKYHVPGVIWYEDYNGVYHRDSLLFNDGMERDPMRFLNWADARRLATIDRTAFIKHGTYEAMPDLATYNLQFEQGDARLNLRDSETVAQRDSMFRWLDNYYRNKDGQISNIIIRGYSSPEGREARNRELAHDRAETIKSLLVRSLPGIKIETQFDANDNIVPWQRIADIMTSEMDDTLAHRYADILREIIAGKTGFDAQYRAIRTHGELYDYIDKHVLNRVRVVDIQANVIVQKILSGAEIVERFERDPQFRFNMVPYQYYAMLCYLADEERWDELYDVAKRAYTKYDKEREVWKQFLKPGTTDSLQYVASRIPYPLAGYYYAVATLKKGIADVNILKPYLDDGKVNRLPEVNSFPFIVAQVLMYCQREEFDGANNLIKKYNLTAFPELEGLTMFVRCLDGQYKGKENEDVRRYIMSTSEMNKAVLYAALGQYREALAILYGSDVPRQDAKVEYLKAICHFRLQNSRLTAPDADGFSGNVVYRDPEDMLPEDNDSGIYTTVWAAPMLNAFRLDERNVEYLKHDGYFNDAYRQMMLYFWKRLKAGVPIDRVVAEYDALVAQMRKNKAQDKLN